MNFEENKGEDSAAAAVRGLSTQDFMSFGVGYIAYVQRQSVPAGVIWSVHAADGAPLSLHGDIHEALEAVRSGDLRPVRVH